MPQSTDTDPRAELRLRVRERLLRRRVEAAQLYDVTTVRWMGFGRTRGESLWHAGEGKAQRDVFEPCGRDERMVVTLEHTREILRPEQFGKIRYARELPEVEAIRAEPAPVAAWRPAELTVEEKPEPKIAAGVTDPEPEPPIEASAREIGEGITGFLQAFGIPIGRARRRPR
jgi:hypothetical protein